MLSCNFSITRFMKNIFYSCILLVSTNLTIIGQSLHIYSGANLGEEWKDINFIQQDKNYLFAFKSENKKSYLLKYDKDSLLERSIIRIPLPDRETLDYSIENLFISTERYLVFYSFFSKAESKQKLEMVAFDTLGRQIGENRLIDFAEAEKERKAGEFMVYNDWRNDRFISYHYAHNRKNSYVDFDHFDYSGNKTGSKQYELNRIGSVKKSFIDDKNNIYQVIEGKAGPLSRSYSVRIYGLQKDSAVNISLNKPLTSLITLSDFFKTIETSDSTLIILTPYKTNKFSNFSKGIYLVQINTRTGGLLNEKIIPFKEGESEKEDARSNDLDLSSCIITKIVFLKSGRLMIIFESRLRTTNSFYGATISETYDINDIITVEMTPEFAVDDIHKIGKRQRTNSSNAIFTGFAVLKKENNLYYIYNELEANLKRNPDNFERLDSRELDDAVIIAASIKDDKVKREAIVVKKFDKETDVVMPGTAFEDNYNNAVYVFRKIKLSVYLSKVYL